MNPQKLIPLIGVWILILGFATAVAQEAVEPAVALASDATEPHLVSADGFALYATVQDDQGAPTCTDACAETWMPVLVDDVVRFSEGVDLRLLGAVARPDGGLQLTYNDWPLYRYSGDPEPGATEGSGLQDRWFLVDGNGALIQSASSADDPAYAQGREVFANVCAECHGAEGQGGSGPRLVGRASLADARDIARKLIRGFGYMPAFGGQLSNEEIAAVLTYVRTTWGNEFGAVTPEEVRSAR